MWLPLSRIVCIAATILSLPPAGRPGASGTAPKGPATDTVTERARQLRTVLEQELDRLDAALVTLGSPRTIASRALTRRAFRQARREYKQAEGMVEFYASPLVTALNGPGTAENDDEPTDGRIVLRGFPLLEPVVFSTAGDEQDRAHLRTRLSTIPPAVAAMRTALRQFRAATKYVTVTDAQRLEIARLEIARVSTLGIAGFDAVASGDGIVESAAALEGTRRLFTTGATASDRQPVRALQRAIAYLRAHPDFDDFDRFTFLTRYANPAAHAVGDVYRALSGPQLVLRRAWTLGAGSVFDAGAIDAQAYAPAEAPRPTPALVALGRALFFDPVLSGNGERACASCHRPERGFADGQPRARPFGPGVPLTRHTPSIINAAYQPAQFVDERAASLEQQIGIVLASPSEMHASVEQSVSVLRQSADYRREFGQVFAVSPSNAITGYRLRIALAAYVRSLGAMNSRFDRAMRGEPHRLRPHERRGFNLFMGRGRCGTCHFAPLFNGTAPPTYLSSEVEIIGVPVSRAIHGGVVDPDSGRAAIDHLDGHLHAFKTPTVRNATLAGAYMHNGVFRTLHDVVDFYNRGGGAGVGVDVPNATLSPTPLHLSAPDQRDIIAFLGALVDTAGLTQRPSRLPRFEHSKRLTDRPIGGRY